MPGGVEQRHRIAVEIEMHLDDVARGAGMRRHDRHLAPRDPIEQRRLAGIGRTRDRDHQALAQAFAAPLSASASSISPASALRRSPAPARSVRRDIALVGEIDAGLDQRQRLDEPRRARLARVSPSSPFSWRNACRRCASVSASIRSARPSTSVRSSLPFSNARRVNSPGSAGRNPRSPRAPRTAPRSPRARHATAARRRPRRSRCSAPETTAPAHRRSAARRRRAAARASPPRLRQAAGQRRERRPACGPEMRTTAIAAGGRPDEGRRWSAPADASPICAGAIEKATQLNSVADRQTQGREPTQAGTGKKMLQNPERRPPPRHPDRNKYNKIQCVIWLTNP